MQQSSASVEWFPTAKSRQDILSTDVAIATVKTSVNRENVNLSLFCEPQQIAIRTRSDDAWPLIDFTPCEKQKYQVTFATKNVISRSFAYN